MTAFVTPSLHGELVEIESEIDEMKFGNNTTIGRYIVDIDGALCATNQAALSATDILALAGQRALNAQVIWDIYDDAVILGANDKILLNEQTVTFFRTRSCSQLFGEVMRLSDSGMIAEAA